MRKLLLAAGLLLAISTPALAASSARANTGRGSANSFQQPVAVPSLSPVPGLSQPSLGLSLAPVLAAPAAPQVQGEIEQIQLFRVHAGRPQLNAAQVAELAAGTPVQVAEAKVQAARLLLSSINPQFSPEPVLSGLNADSPQILELKAAIRAARGVMAEARVAGLRAGLSQDGRVSEAALERVYAGSSRIERLIGRLPVSPKTTADLRELVRDGAYGPALEHFGLLRRSVKALKSGAGRAAGKELVKALEDAPDSPPVLQLSERKGFAEGLLRKGSYGEAHAAAKEFLEEAKTSGLAHATSRFFGVAALTLEEEIRRRGSSRLYGARGLMSAEKLEARVRGLLARDPGAYVGDLLPRTPTRIQCYGDCAVQQAYNHPLASQAAGLMPYETFLDAVEGLMGERVRRTGLTNSDSDSLLRALGLRRRSQGVPKTEAELLDLLRMHGALLFSMRWTPSQSLRERDGDHAVLLQGAFRNEERKWVFVVLDSNESAPQLFSFAELGVMGATHFDVVEAVPAGDKRLPAGIRDLADQTPRLRAMAARFYAEHGAVRSYVPGWKALLYGAVNFFRARLGRDPLEPAPRRKLDPRLIPFAQAPAPVLQALRAGRLPAEAVVTLPGGRKFINGWLAERLLSRRP
ncbi:MAG: hypothetical protein HY926_04080 [Elusimicrobia bacterium]|nr:hypothetical protein [Elusimicrobiota bacterium]